MEKAQFINLIDNLGALASKDKWAPSYDKKLDQFYWHKKPLSTDASLVKVSHEASLYFSKKGDVEGVLVEYLKSNFVDHNPVFSGLTSSFNVRVDNSLFTVSTKDLSKIKPQLFGLVEAVKADIYKDAWEKSYSVGDLSKLTNFAIKE